HCSALLIRKLARRMLHSDANELWRLGIPSQGYLELLLFVDVDRNTRQHATIVVLISLPRRREHPVMVPNLDLRHSASIIAWRFVRNSGRTRSLDPRFSTLLPGLRRPLIAFNRKLPSARSGKRRRIARAPPLARVRTTGSLCQRAQNDGCADARLP